VKYIIIHKQIMDYMHTNCTYKTAFVHGNYFEN